MRDKLGKNRASPFRGADGNCTRVLLNRFIPDSQSSPVSYYVLHPIDRTGFVRIGCMMHSMFHVIGMHHAFDIAVSYATWKPIIETIIFIGSTDYAASAKSAELTLAFIVRMHPFKSAVSMLLTGLPVSELSIANRYYSAP